MQTIYDANFPNQASIAIKSMYCINHLLSTGTLNWNDNCIDTIARWVYQLTCHTSQEVGRWYLYLLRHDNCRFPYGVVVDFHSGKSSTNMENSYRPMSYNTCFIFYLPFKWKDANNLKRITSTSESSLLIDIQVLLDPINSSD